MSLIVYAATFDKILNQRIRRNPRPTRQLQWNRGGFSIWRSRAAAGLEFLVEASGGRANVTLSDGFPVDRSYA